MDGAFFSPKTPTRQIDFRSPKKPEKLILNETFEQHWVPVSVFSHRMLHGA